MATREVVCLNETTPQLEVPQAADTYTFPRAITNDLIMVEAADHSSTPAAGFGYLWTKNTVPSTLIFTDDAGTDLTLATGGGDLLADGTVPLTANWDVGAFTITALTFVSDQATGTAPFTVASTTQVANLNAATAGNAATVTTNANLTGHVTSTGNAAILGSFTVAQLSTALSDATISGNNSGDQTITGKQTMWVPAGAMRPTVSNGCAALTDVETTAGRPDMTVLDFDAAADEHAQFQVAFPKQWALGTVTFQAFWTTTATGTTGVAFGLQGVAASDADTIDVVYGTAVVVTDDAQTAAEDMYVTAESGAVTIAGTPADDDACFFRVFRDVSDANDDMTEDARLIGIKIFYTTDAATDA